MGVYANHVNVFGLVFMPHAVAPTVPLSLSKSRAHRLFWYSYCRPEPAAAQHHPTPPAPSLLCSPRQSGYPPWLISHQTKQPTICHPPLVLNGPAGLLLLLLLATNDDNRTVLAPCVCVCVCTPAYNLFVHCLRKHSLTRRRHSSTLLPVATAKLHRTWLGLAHSIPSVHAGEPAVLGIFRLVCICGQRWAIHRADGLLAWRWLSWETNIPLLLLLLLPEQHRNRSLCDDVIRAK